MAVGSRLGAESAVAAKNTRTPPSVTRQLGRSDGEGDCPDRRAKVPDKDLPPRASRRQYVGRETETKALWTSTPSANATFVRSSSRRPCVGRAGMRCPRFARKLASRRVESSSAVSSSAAARRLGQRVGGHEVRTRTHHDLSNNQIPSSCRTRNHRATRRRPVRHPGESTSPVRNDDRSTADPRCNGPAATATHASCVILARV